MATLTGEYTQPVRLCYKVYDKQAIHSKIFKKLKCMSYDSSNNRWVWLFDHEAKNLSFKKTYKELPKHLHPIVIGSFFSDNDDEMHLDLRSPERAEHAIVFFYRYPLSFSHYPKKYLDGRFGFAITEHWPSLNDRFTRLTGHLMLTSGSLLLAVSRQSLALKRIDTSQLILKVTKEKSKGYASSI